MQELKRLRSERGWSQQKLADVSGVNKVTINQIERGRRSPNVETLEKLADALGAEVADFFPKAQAPLPFQAGRPEQEEERRVYDAILEAAQAAKELRAKVEDLVHDEDAAQLEADLQTLAAEAALQTQGFRERGVYTFVGDYRAAQIVLGALRAGRPVGFPGPREAQVQAYEDVLQKTPDDVKEAIATMRAERDAIGELLRSLPEQAREQFESALAA